MSSSRVIVDIEDKIEAVCQAILTPITYYNTINKRRNPPRDETWCTASFFSFDAENICYGGPGVIESGNVTVSLFGKSGRGWQELRMIADQMIDAFRSEPINGVGTDLVILTCTAPNEASEGDATQWYSIDFDMEYQLFK